MLEKLGASLVWGIGGSDIFEESIRGAPDKRTVVFSAGAAAERKIIQSQSEDILWPSFS